MKGSFRVTWLAMDTTYWRLQMAGYTEDETHSWKLVRWASGGIAILASIPVFLACALPAFALYAVARFGSWKTEGVFAIVELLFYFAAQIWLAAACLGLALKTLSGADMSRCLQWFAVSGFLGSFLLILLDTIPTLSAPSGRRSFFVLGYTWPAMLSIATILLWLWLRRVRANRKTTVGH